MASQTVRPDQVPALEARLHMQTFYRQPVTLVRGAGTAVWDADGKMYLDFCGGLGALVLGHAPKVLADALARQAETLILTTNAFYTVPQIELARLLVERSALDRVFFTNSGAEANECAIKLARKWGKRNRAGASVIVSAKNSFHGRTIATLAATGHAYYRQDFDPFPPGFRHVPYDDLDAIARAVQDDTAAVLLEPVLGERGVIPASRAYLDGVRRICSERGVLLMLDEIQSGVGRTGTLWAYEGYGIEPDVMTVAKGLGGGVPIGACLAKEAAAAFEPGDHGSTYGGNPLVCAASHAVLGEVLARDLPGRARAMGARLTANLNALPPSVRAGIAEIRSVGLWMAIELARPCAADVLARARGLGVLANRTPENDVIRISPPLVVTEAECDRFAEIMGEALASV
jgi:predicted acetylornithine/succinylornithine family transaminase